jgi:hypothetical protein
MSTYDETIGGGGQPAAVDSHNSVYRVSRVLDCAKANSGNGLSSADVAKLVAVPAGFMTLAVHSKVLEAERATLTYDVGDGDSVNRYHDGIDGNSASTDANDATNQYYASDDTIDVVVNNDAGSARIQVDVVMVDVDSSKPLSPA